MRLTRCIVLSGIVSACAGSAPAPRTAQPPQRPLIVDAAQLPALLAEPNLVVLDVQPDEASFSKLHLKGARFVDWNVWDRKIDRDLEQVDAEWTAMLSALGIERSSRVLLYDNSRMSWSAPIWLALTRFGVSEIHIVSTRFSRFAPGLPAHLLETGPGQPVQPTAAEWTILPGPAPGLASKQQVAALIAKPAPLLFDNRTREEFDGAESAAEAGVRPGHIPRSILLPWHLFFDDRDEPRAPVEVAAIMKSFGATPADAITLTCRAGGRATATGLILWESGFRNVAIYSGSWLEWSGDPTLPADTR